MLGRGQGKGIKCVCVSCTWICRYKCPVHMWRPGQDLVVFLCWPLPHWLDKGLTLTQNLPFCLADQPVSPQPVFALQFRCDRYRQGHSPTFYIGARDLNSSALTHRTVSPALIVSIIFIYFYLHTCHSVHVNRVQGAACKSWFSPCTMWILGTQICRCLGHCLNPLKYLALAFVFLR